MMIFKIQFFAKGSSGGSGGGGGGGVGANTGSQSTTKKEYHSSSGGGSGSSTGGSRIGSGKSKSKGESVSSVSRSETYEIYRVEGGKEEYMRDRDGATILSKMHYDKNRGSWISNDKGRKYVIRKKK